MGSNGIDNATSNIEQEYLVTFVRLSCLILFMLIGIFLTLLGIWLSNIGVVLNHGFDDIPLFRSIDYYVALPGFGLTIYGIILLFFTWTFFRKDNIFFIDYYSSFKASCDSSRLGRAYRFFAKQLARLADRFNNKAISGLFLVAFNANFIALLISTGYDFFILTVTNLYFFIFGIGSFIAMTVLCIIWITLKERRHKYMF